MPLCNRFNLHIALALALFGCDDSSGGDCQVDMDCPGVQRCIEGECVTLTCPQVECPQGHECIQGQCYPDSCGSLACLDGEVCEDGDCVDIDCLAVVCDPPAVCIEGECSESDPCEGVTCDDGKECTEDSCQAGQCRFDPVADETECGARFCVSLEWRRQVCLAGSCSDYQVEAQCDDGDSCSNDSCIPESGCQHTPTAPGGDCGICSACNDQGECVDDLGQDEDCEPCMQCGAGGSCEAGPAETFCEDDSLVVCDGEGGVESSQECPLGCHFGATPERCNQLDPSNFVPDLLCAGTADVTISGETFIDTDSGTIGGLVPDGMVVTHVSQEDPLPEIAVLSVNSLDVQAEVTVTGQRALAILACSDISVSALINAGAGGPDPGPGGYAGGIEEQSGQGYLDGAGQRGVHDANGYCSGGGGGGSGGVGGDGGASAVAGGAGGQVTLPETLEPLVGGSGGGAGGHVVSANSARGGGGGGAVQLSAGGKLSISAGGKNAGGAGASRPQAIFGCGAGGGAGGSILLEGVTVTVFGTLSANGGGGSSADMDNGDGQDGQLNDVAATGGEASSLVLAGGSGAAGAVGDGETAATTGDRIPGGGGGAAGRIRINTLSGDAEITGVVSPSETSGLFSTGTIEVW